MEQDIKVKSLYKALKLLDYFTAENPERGISELAELSGLLKSSVYNIMNTFEKCGFIEKNRRTEKYRLGAKILALSNAFNQSSDLQQTAKSFMDALAQKTGESVYLATPYNTEIIYVETAYPKDSVYSRSIKGVIAPMYCTGIGKAILAFMPEDFIRQILDNGLERFTPNTITDPARFMEELRLTRERGYSIDDMEHEYGIKCVGTPIIMPDQRIAGAISLSGPSLRFTKEKIAEYAGLLKEASGQIARRIL